MRVKLTTLLMVAVLLSGLLPVSHAAAQKELTDVTQVGFLVIDIAPVLIGIQKGYFKDEGLNMKFVEIDSGQLGERDGHFPPLPPDLHKHVVPAVVFRGHA